MNRILCRRYAVNIFWTAIYGCLVGYVFYANYAARLNPVATLNEEALSVAAVAKQGNGSVDGDDDVIAALRRSQPGKMRARARSETFRSHCKRSSMYSIVDVQ